MAESFKQISERPLFFGGQLAPTPERNHYLLCDRVGANELYHLRYRAQLKGVEPPQAPWKIHFYSYLLSNLDRRETILFYREDFYRPSIQAEYLANSTTRWVANRIQAISLGNLPPLREKPARAYLMPGKISAHFWEVVCNHFINNHAVP